VETIRITTQPFPEYTRELTRDQALAFFREFDEFSLKEDFLPDAGPAMMRDSDDAAPVKLLAEVLCKTRNIEGSLIVAADDGIHWKAVRAAADLMKYVAAHSEHSQGNFNFAATAMLDPYAPFFPGSYHTGAGHSFAVGMESANIVDEAFASTGDSPDAGEQLAKALTVHAKAVEAIAVRVAKESGWTYLGIDPTPVPLREVSIGAAMERFTGSRFGSSGTLTAAAVITQAIRSLPVKQVGYRGLMLPVLEDSRISQRWGEGAVSLDALLAYSSVCGTGLDTIPLPGDVSAEQLARIIGDVASLAVKWHKPLTARLLLVEGKKAGQRTEFDDPYLVNTVLQPLP
jgi:uncharacterized protein (UPF0210 family)